MAVTSTIEYCTDRDIYDVYPKINIMDYVEVPANKRVVLAMEQNKNLIAQAKQLNFVNEPSVLAGGFLCQMSHSFMPEDLSFIEITKQS